MTKRRGRRSSRQQRRGERSPSESHRNDSRLDLTLQRAQRWIDRGRPEEAIELLEPLAASSSRHPEVHLILGYAKAESGDLWDAMSAFEEAARLDDDPKYVLPLAGLYIEAGLPVHALWRFRSLIKRGVSTPFMKEVRQTATLLEQDMAKTAQRVNRPVERIEQGHYDMERGHRAMSEHDFRVAIAAYQLAIKQLGDWPPPHNNLSQALFYNGQPREAVQEVRRALANHPANLSALANGIRFLTWSGREEEARDLWARLKEVTPRDPGDRLKKAEAAAVLAEHESVYQTLKPFERMAGTEDLPYGLLSRAQVLMAIAEANTGRRQEAERRLKTLHDPSPLVAETLAALRAGQPGTGWAKEFRYFHLLELVPVSSMDELLGLVEQADDLPSQHFRRRIRRFAERYPQVVRVAEKMIWEERQPEGGVDLLSTIGTPEAYAALRRFGLSQAGGDRARVAALTALAEAGEIGEEETVRAWLKGEWREIQLQLQPMPEDMWRESDYEPRVVDMLNRALTAYQWDEVDQAEELFERVLELDPSVKEAYNNLGTMYARREENERAKQMFRRAVELDPLYVFPLCNLATYLLYEDRLEEVEELLEPLTRVDRLEPQEAAFYTLTRARLLIAREEYDGAERILESLLEVRPDYEPAQDLLEWLQGIGNWSYWEEQWERDHAWRLRLQEKLDTLRPSLTEALPLYTKDALTEMARWVMRWGGWSSLRKAELVDALVEALTDLENLAWVVGDLSQEEEDALRTVLAEGGAMSWEAFDTRYGNDLEESRHWQWHPPETIMGRLRLQGLLVEATVDGELYVAVPLDLRELLATILG